MSFPKTILTWLIIPFILAACNTDQPAVVSELETTVPEEFTPTVEIRLPDPTGTPFPAATFTAEPLPELPTIKIQPTAEEQMLSKSEETRLVIQPGIVNVKITGAEGLALQGTLYTPEGSASVPGVILLHMLGSDRTAWDDTGLTDDLIKNGYVVLAVDMRGHGDTGGNIDWQLAPEDLQHVWDYFSSLEFVDPQRTAIIGASIGANLALRTGADQPIIRSVILLSPGLDYRSVSTMDPLQVYGARPILIVASEEDKYAADSSRKLTDLAQGESELVMYDGAGHGTNMFSAQPDLGAVILSWLDKNLN